MTKNNFPRLRFSEFNGVWNSEKLGELSDIVRGASPRPIKDKRWFSDTSEIGWIRISDVTSQNGKIRELAQHLSEEGQKKTRVLKSPHLLLSIAASVGKPVINYVPTGVHDGFLIFKNPKFNINYMYSYLDYFQNQWNKFGQPGSQVNLNSDLVKSLILYLPNKDEQDKISVFVSKMDKLIELQTQKLEQLKKLKQGYLQKVFPQDGESVPRLRFSGFSGEWKEEKLKETLKVGKSGGTPSTKNKEYYDGTIPFLSIKDVTESNGIIDDTEKHINNDAIQNSSSWIVPKGSLTISMYASVGSVAKFSSDVATSQAFFNMIFKDGINVDFMYHFFNQYNLMGRWKRLIATGTQGNLNATEINNILVRIPSEIEQRKIASFLSKLDQIINNQSDKINSLQQEKKSYLQKMFI